MNPAKANSIISQNARVRIACRSVKLISSAALRGRRPDTAVAPAAADDDAADDDDDAADDDDDAAAVPPDAPADAPDAAVADALDDCDCALAVPPSGSSPKSSGRRPISAIVGATPTASVQMPKAYHAVCQLHAPMMACAISGITASPEPCKM